MEQKREPKNRSTQIETTDFLTKKNGNSMEKGSSFWQMVLEQTDVHNRHY